MSGKNNKKLFFFLAAQTIVSSQPLFDELNNGCEETTQTKKHFTDEKHATNYTRYYAL